MNGVKTSIGEIEWRTVALGVFIYFGWIMVTLWHADLPWWAFSVVAAWFAAWQSSLQHEAVHCHPTRSEALNTLFAGWPLLIWLPYGVYRRQHLWHHRDGDLTDPTCDTESYYVSRDAWGRMGYIGQGLAWVLNTLAGRLVLGPPVIVTRFLWAEVGRVIAGEPEHRRAWILHIPAAALVVAWLVFVAEMPLWLYLVAVVWPGSSLMLLRSFIEHRAAAPIAERTAIVDRAWPFSWLYLHNNLHVVHHAVPRAPWYELPALYRARQAEISRDNGGYVFSGYSEVARRYLWRAKDHPAHPTI